MVKSKSRTPQKTHTPTHWVRNLSIFLSILLFSLFISQVQYTNQLHQHRVQVNTTYKKIIEEFKSITVGELIEANIPSLEEIKNNQMYGGCFRANGSMTFRTSRSFDEVIREYNILTNRVGLVPSENNNTYPLSPTYFNTGKSFFVTISPQGESVDNKPHPKTMDTYQIRFNFADPSVSDCSG
jgi:hypothetical protein